MPPITQKLIAAVAVFVVVIGGLGAGIYAKSGENGEISEDVERLRGEIAGLDAIIATREQKKKHRDAQDEVFKELISVLPQYSERQEERVYEAVTSYGSLAKIRFGGLVPKPVQVMPPPGAAPPPTAPGAPPKPPGAGGAPPTDFTQTELTLRFEGTFHNFLRFINMVENHESFLRVDTIQLTPLRPADGPQPEQLEVSIVVRISTFHYVAK
jgi:hypothetical protein